MDLSKPRLELRSSGRLPEGGCCDPEASQAGHLRFGFLTRLKHMVERNPSALEASAYSEMRHAQTDARIAKENALARLQLARQLVR